MMYPLCNKSSNQPTSTPSKSTNTSFTGENPTKSPTDCSTITDKTNFKEEVTCEWIGN